MTKLYAESGEASVSVVKTKGYTQKVRRLRKALKEGGKKKANPTRPHDARTAANMGGGNYWRQPAKHDL